MEPPKKQKIAPRVGLSLSFMIMREEERRSGMVHDAVSS